jgi:hypothetical protein
VSDQFKPEWLTSYESIRQQPAQVVFIAVDLAGCGRDMTVRAIYERDDQNKLKLARYAASDE